MSRTFKSLEDKTAWEHSTEEKLTNLEQRALLNPNLYYKLTPAVGFKVIDKKLSVNACHLWIYLCSLFPFGDRPVQMPTQAELALRLGVSTRSIIRAVAELDEADLWTFQIERWKGRNMTGHKSPGKLGKSDDSSVTPDDNPVTPDDNSVLKDDSSVTPDDKLVTPTTPEPLPVAASGSPHTIHTLKTIHTLSEGDEPELERELFEVSGMPIAPYREWLRRKSESLPIKPALIGKWIQSMAVKLEVQQDFCDHIKSKNRTSVPLALAPAVENNLPKAFVDMNPQEQADFMAAIAAAARISP